MLPFQAKKRKLGLVDDDDDVDISKLADITSTKEQNFVEGKDIDGFTVTGKIRGMLLLKHVWNMHFGCKMVLLCPLFFFFFFQLSRL